MKTTVTREDAQAALERKSRIITVHRPKLECDALGLEPSVTLPRATWKAVQAFFDANPQCGVAEVHNG